MRAGLVSAGCRGRPLRRVEHFAEWSAIVQTEQRCGRERGVERHSKAARNGPWPSRSVRCSNGARERRVEMRAKIWPHCATTCSSTVATPRNDLQRIDDGLEQSRKVAEELRAAPCEEYEVADLLGSRLRSDRFEKWLLVEALDTSWRRLPPTHEALSSGQYSLRSGGDDEFVVVDHRNADETRRCARSRAAKRSRHRSRSRSP